MNYELTWRGRVIQRKHGHLWGTNAGTPPPLTPYCTQTRSTNRHHAPLLRQPICNPVRKRAKRVLPPMLQHHCYSAISSCQLFRVTCRLVLTHFSDMAGSPAAVYPVIWLRGGLVLTALLLITESGERATPTYWLTGSSTQHAGTLLVKMLRACLYSGFALITLIYTLDCL